MLDRWRLLQLADSAFPAGGYAHSAGLEALLGAPALAALPREELLVTALEQALVTAATQALPYVRAAQKEPAAIATLDAAYATLLTGAVAAEASRTLGKSLAMATFAALEDEALRPLRAPLARGCHFAPTFGALFGALGASAAETEELYLFGVARTLVSAAVRLNALGPFAGQRLQDRAGRRVATLLTLPRRAVDEAASASPLLDLFQERHPLLTTKLFQS